MGKHEAKIGCATVLLILLLIGALIGAFFGLILGVGSFVSGLFA